MLVVIRLAVRLVRHQNLESVASEAMSPCTDLSFEYSPSRRILRSAKLGAREAQQEAAASVAAFGKYSTPVCAIGGISQFWSYYSNCSQRSVVSAIWDMQLTFSYTGWTSRKRPRRQNGWTPKGGPGLAMICHANDLGPALPSAPPLSSAREVRQAVEPGMPLDFRSCVQHSSAGGSFAPGSDL